MRNKVRRTCRFDRLQQAQLTLKTSSPTKYITNIAQGQSMVHSASNGDYFFVCKFIDDSRVGCKDSSSKSQRSKITFSDSKQISLFCHDDIVFFSTSDLFDFVALKSKNYLMNGKHLLSIVFKVIFQLRMKCSNNILRFYIV